MAEVEVVVAAGATPVARVMASRLRAASGNKRVAALVRRMRGSFAIRSATDPQHVTVALKAGKVKVKPGVAQDADLVIEADLSKLDSPGYKPKVSGHWRHPRLARQVSRLLRAPLPDWQSSAQKFWAASAALPDLPSKLTILCQDEGSSLSLGSGESVAELHGKSQDLAKLFLGHEVLAYEIFRDKIKVKMTLQHIAGLSDAGIDLLMDELPTQHGGDAHADG